MGFLDNIFGKLQQINEEGKEAQAEAERWSAETICDEIARTSSLVKNSGYRIALRIKCQKMNNRELKSLFKWAGSRYRNGTTNNEQLRNNIILDTIRTEMSNKGLL